MSRRRHTPLLSGREARRRGRFGPEARLKGAGWTRKFRKGREQRLHPAPIEHHEEEEKP